MVALRNIAVPTERLADHCRKWRVRELAVFGSVLRDDFNAESDIDLLVTFEADAPWSLWELVDMQDEFAALLGRRIDLVEPEALTNPYRRQEILSTSRVIYASEE